MSQSNMYETVKSLFLNNIGVHHDVQFINRTVKKKQKQKPKNGIIKFQL